MSVMDIFAERIKLLREERGLGVREAAAMMGISHSAQAILSCNINEYLFFYFAPAFPEMQPLYLVLPNL